MTATSPQLLELSRQECLRLLVDSRLGRLAINLGEGPPVIRPVNYLFDPASQAVVFRTAAGSKLYALLHAARAAFEVDAVDEGSRTGWSVIVRGVTGEITNRQRVDRLERMGLETWAPGERPHWIEIRAWTVSGRRIALPADVPAGKYLG